MKTESEIKDNLSHIEYHHSLISDLYQKGKYDGLKWVLEDDEYSEPKINREKEELEAEINAFTQLHDATVNINNAFIKHHLSHIYKESLFDDVQSALIRIIAIKKNKLKIEEVKE